VADLVSNPKELNLGSLLQWPFTCANKTAPGDHARDSGDPQETTMPTDTTRGAPPIEPGKQAFWPYGWWKLMEIRIGIIPLPMYVIAGALIAGLVVTGILPNEISFAIVMLSFVVLMVVLFF
jgi:hypothetical protein